MRTAVASLVALASAVSAVGNAIVVNNTPDTIYLWSVGDSTGEQNTVSSGGSWSEGLHTGSINPGIAIKITTVEGGMSSGAATQILGYTLDPTRVWYSLDSVNGEPFDGHKLTVTSHGGGTIEWPTGKDVGELTRDSSSEEDVVFTINAGL